MYSVILMTTLSAGVSVPQTDCCGWGAGLGAYGYGGAFGCAGGAFACMGCYGGYQSWWSGAGGFGGYGANMVAPAPEPARSPRDFFGEVPAEAAPASVIVQMPADAKLLVEGRPLTLDPRTGGFTTPKLQPGAQYVYTLRVEFVRDGRVQTESKEVNVAAGVHTEVRFDGSPPVAARTEGPPTDIPRPQRRLETAITK
jgi:uncharacterized protein (TIGR03000 family)